MAIPERRSGTDRRAGFGPAPLSLKAERRAVDKTLERRVAGSETGEVHAGKRESFTVAGVGKADTSVLRKGGGPTAKPTSEE